ncbi:MAG TPA: phosphate-starvation-inducible PsiE family protein [Chloroflexota bacterium]|nr:phosphate-starvation-inducible PsiE family protein [Chloroflexota bacterium]
MEAGRDDAATDGQKQPEQGPERLEQGQPAAPGAPQRAGHQGAQVAGVEPHTRLHRLLRAPLESVQDLIVLGLCAVLFLIMVRALWDLGRGALATHVDVRSLLSQVLFVTLLVELYRLLVVYLREHRVAVDFVVEITMVSALREVVLRGVTQLAWQQLLAITAFILGLGALLRLAAIRIPERKHGGQPLTWRL